MIDDVAKNEKINRILNDEEYINWLANFTLDVPKFYCDSWGCSNQVIHNIQDISILYEIIQNFANENYIEPTLTACGNYYSLKHNNAGYNIGVMKGPETIYYCTRVKNAENYIYFKDIQNNTKTSTALIVDTKTEELTKLINDMVESNISDQVILEVTKKSLQKVLKNKKNLKL